MRQKGWMLNPDWRRYYEMREESKDAAFHNSEQTRLLSEAVAIQTENAKKQREHEENQRRHMEECHAEKVESGALPHKQRTN